MAAANSEYTHSRVNAMMSVPITTDSTMLPPGNMAGACRSRSTEPTATFMPSVFMISASHRDTSRTRPVALRVKLKSCGAPVARAGVDVMRSLPARSPGRGRGWGKRLVIGGVGGGADDVLELAADAVALE